MDPVVLNIENRAVKSTEVTYLDLFDLYSQFIKNNGYIPTTKECTAQNNLPQPRIIKRVLKDVGMTYKDFLSLFGKKFHVRASSADYKLFLRKFKLYSDKLGRPLTSVELVSEEYNLPSVKWFVKFCPDKSVKNYRDFVSWCGYKPCKKVWTQEEVSIALRRFEAENGRNITSQDITTANIGFSMIVIKRLFGSLENARTVCGLLPLSPRYCSPNEYYIETLRDVVLDYKQKTGNPYISWLDIESGEYGAKTYNHKCYSKHFKDAGVDLFAYVKSLGCLMSQMTYSDSYIFDSGELVRSSLEYSFSTYLNECGLIYKEDYERDVRYRTFLDTRSKIDCDYVIDINGTPVYIEIAGVLDSSRDGLWDVTDYQDSRHEFYRDTLLKKRSLLESIGAEYYFVFKDDMKNGAFKSLIDSLAARRTTPAGFLN